MNRHSIWHPPEGLQIAQRCLHRVSAGSAMSFSKTDEQVVGATHASSSTTGARAGARTPRPATSRKPSACKVRCGVSPTGCKRSARSGRADEPGNGGRDVRVWPSDYAESQPGNRSWPGHCDVAPWRRDSRRQSLWPLARTRPRTARQSRQPASHDRLPSRAGRGGRAAPEKRSCAQSVSRLPAGIPSVFSLELSPGRLSDASDWGVASRRAAFGPKPLRKTASSAPPQLLSVCVIHISSRVTACLYRVSWLAIKRAFAVLSTALATRDEHRHFFPGMSSVVIAAPTMPAQRRRYDRFLPRSALSAY
jgi:hypothetical protein